jgi:glycosyltransferase involved in cell wall biosynthesis
MPRPGLSAEKDLKMRIGLDFHAAEQEGTGNCSYIRSLAESLLVLGGPHEYLLYITEPSLPYYRAFRGRPNVSLRPLRARHALARIPSLGLKTRADRVDVLHVQYVAPPVHGGRLVVSVHDLSFIRTPRFFPASQRLYLGTLVPPSLRRADAIITISEYSRRDIQAWYPGAAAKIHVTPLAAASGFKPDRDRRRRQDMARRLGFAGPYLLSVSRLDPRKNLAMLIEAFAGLKKKGGIPHRLVIAGGPGTVPQALRAAARTAGLGDQVVFPGFIPDALLPALYSLAEVFLCPSLYEGFGLPVLEAMACGCPVICADASALPEVAGRAGLLVDPLRPRGWSEAIKKTLSSRALRQRMKRSGLRQSQRFSWEETARKTLAVYETAVRPTAVNG